LGGGYYALIWERIVVLEAINWVFNIVALKEFFLFHWDEKFVDLVE